MKQEAQKISKKKMTAVMKRMRIGKNAGTILEVWRCLREMTVDFLARSLNTILWNASGMEKKCTGSNFQELG